MDDSVQAKEITGNQQGREDKANSTAQNSILDRNSKAFAGESGQPEDEVKDIKKYMDDLKSTRDHHDRTLRELDDYKSELHRTIGEYRVSKRQCLDLQSQNRKLEDLVQGLQSELIIVQRNFEDAKALSESRGKELRGTQDFLTRTKADSLAISDLIQKVTTINGEIFQAADSLGVSLAQAKKKQGLSEEEAQKVFNNSIEEFTSPHDPTSHKAVLPEYQANANPWSPPNGSSLDHDQGGEGERQDNAKSTAAGIMGEIPGVLAVGSRQPRDRAKDELQKYGDSLRRTQSDSRTPPDPFDAEKDQKDVGNRKALEDNVKSSDMEKDGFQRYKDDVKKIREDRDRALMDLDYYKAELDRAVGEYHDQTQMELDNYRSELNRSIGEYRSSRRYCHDLESDKQKLKDLVQGLQHELNNVQRKFEDAKSLADTRGKEPQRVFLTKADSLAISDLIQQVTSVNEEIFQAAASLGESLIRRKRDLSKDEAQDAYKNSCNVVGMPATALLQAEALKSDAEINPLLVQVILQTILTAFCAGKIQNWTPGEPVFDNRIRGLYQEIRHSSKDQAVSGRWRALTLAHIIPDTRKWKDEVIRALVNVMRVASWDIGTLEQKNNFGQKLILVFKASVDLRVSLGQKITSADIDVAYIGFGCAFTKVHMEESYGDDRKENNNNEKVIATVGIGLHKVMPPSSTPTFELVVPPKVVLESSLKAALEPAPPQPSRSRRGENRRKKPQVVIDEHSYQDGRD